MKKVQEVVETDTVIPVHVVDKEEVETLYGMTEQEFIQKAVVLDPETRRPEAEPNETEEAEEVEE